MRKNKILLPAAFLFAAISSAFAQGNGIAGITEATNMVTSYFDPGTKLVYAVGAVVGLIGFGACIFLIVAATILRSFFL